MRSFVGLSIFGLLGVLILAYGIWEGAWIAIFAGIALVAVDGLAYWLGQPVKRP
jgi:hypothetical protein